MNSVYDYLDYRKFLKDRVTVMKSGGSPFSNRNFNRRSGLKSSGHLSLIINGRRNLGRDAMYKVCQGFGLGEKESHFFVNLVNFNQARTVDERAHFYKRLLRGYPPAHAKFIDSKHYDVFSRWYYIALLEMVRMKDFKADPVWISNRLKPKVSVSKVKKALADLINLGFIKEAGGRLERVEKMLATPEAVRSVAIMDFHEQLSMLALDSLKKDPVNNKEFSTLTIALSGEDIAVLKKRIQEFKKELHSFIESSDAKKTEVVNISLQLFKMTRSGEQNEKV